VPGASLEHPVVEFLPASTQGVLATLIGSRAVTIEGHAEVVDAKLWH
jgi:hypothetical protein